VNICGHNFPSGSSNAKVLVRAKVEQYKLGSTRMPGKRLALRKTMGPEQVNMKSMARQH
jgi:hypothetical protein